MRKDVKIGMVLALVAVFVAGWYYSRDKQEQRPIPLGDDTPEHAVAEQDAVGEGEAPASDSSVADATPEQNTRTGEPALPETDQPATTVAARGPEDDELADRPTAETRPELLTARSATEDGAVQTPQDGTVGEDEVASASEPVFDLADVFGVSDPADAAEESPADAPPPAAAAQPAEGRTIVQPSVGASASRETTPRNIDSNRRDREPGAAVTGDAAVEQYRVQPGDTLAVLAEIYYGSQRYVSVIVEANPQLTDPNKLQAGSVIAIPPMPDSADRSGAGKAAPASAQTKAVRKGYVVQPGDSFYRIAEKKLGSGARWKELFELNKDVVKGDAKALRPGMVLTLPKKTLPKKK